MHHADPWDEMDRLTSQMEAELLSQLPRSRPSRVSPLMGAAPRLDQHVPSESAGITIWEDPSRWIWEDPSRWSWSRERSVARDPSLGAHAVTGESVPALVRHLYAVVSELEERFPSRKFTPEGQLVGSIGEVLAAHHYGLKLHPASAPDHDATAPDGTMVQVAATQAELVGLRAEPERLLVLSLRRDGSFSEVYNGPGRDAWEAAGKMQENGQRPISLSKLARLMEQVPKSGRLPRT